MGAWRYAQPAIQAALSCVVLSDLVPIERDGDGIAFVFSLLKGSVTPAISLSLLATLADAARWGRVCASAKALDTLSRKPNLPLLCALYYRSHHTRPSLYYVPHLQSFPAKRTTGRARKRGTIPVSQFSSFPCFFSSLNRHSHDCFR